jgi:hypothetical protein
MTTDGRRELLASDPRISCNQPVPLAPRSRPPARTSTVDYRAATGTYYVQDIYHGEGLRGVPRGSIEKLRVVALEYRAAGIGFNYSKGPGGAALSSTPVSVGNGCWDVKVVLGEARVHEDGSACFIVPARTPLYFQAIDRNGHAAQTMRSWSTLQPGELLSCAGCHESKNEAPPPARGPTLALRAGPKELEPFHGGPPRGFSFIREVQPILDRHCVRCHDGERSGPGAHPGPGAADPGIPHRGVAAGAPEQGARRAFSLLGRQTAEAVSGRSWSDAYLALTSATPLPLSRGGDEPLTGRSGDLVSWIGTQSEPPVLPPYRAGAARSRLLRILEDGHGDVRLSREEMETIACWIDLLVPYCGDYLEANAWTEEQRSMYRRFQEKRRKMEELEKEGIAEFLERERSRGARPSHGATVAAPETTR